MTDKPNEAKITQQDLIDMFGETMPIEAVNLVWNSDDKKTLGQIRAELREMAKVADTHESTEQSELEPCPFCGGKVDLETTIDGRKWWGVVCRNSKNVGGTCGISIRATASKEAAIKRWNTRAPKPVEGQDVTQADREAASENWLNNGGTMLHSREIRNGEHDDGPYIKDAIARRHASQQSIQAKLSVMLPPGNLEKIDLQLWCDAQNYMILVHEGDQGFNDAVKVSDALIAMQGRLDAARESLEPFAKLVDCYDEAEDDEHEVWVDAGPITVITDARKALQLRNFRKAAKALSAIDQPEGERS